MDVGVSTLAAVEVKNLNWSFGKTKILREISAIFKKGTFTSIIGPNGSGKTTLLKNISTWFRPERGTVLLNGKDVLSFCEKELAQNMAFVPQNTKVDFEFTAMDIVLMGRAPHISRFRDESSEDIEIARYAMELTNTWHLKDRPANCLSGGELQRIIVARALAQDTDMLLMDEPISHLDIYHQIEVLDLIKRLQRENGLTVISVLHDLNLAAQYSDTLILLNQGTVKCFGRPEEVLTKDNIRQVYGIDVYIIENPVNGLPCIIPMSSTGISVNSKIVPQKRAAKI